MTISIVIAVLNSHEVVRRQLAHFAAMTLPEDVELILVDDGSDPPIEGAGPRVRIHATHDTRPWTQPLARNAGCRLATGAWLILTDIDHLITADLIDAVRRCPYRFLRFKREFGVLDEHGRFTQDLDTLEAYGFPRARLTERGLRLPVHSNSMAIRRDLFWEIGGMPEDRLVYPNREEAVIRQKLARRVAAGTLQRFDDNDRPTIYMFPNGQYCGDVDHNPFGLFHQLSRRHG